MLSRPCSNNIYQPWEWLYFVQQLYWLLVFIDRVSDLFYLFLFLFIYFCGLKYHSGGYVCSSEAKPVLEEKLSEFAASLIAAYDNGEILSALEEGHAGWQKWVKSFGKSLKRKVSESSILCVSFSSFWGKTS